MRFEPHSQQHTQLRGAGILELLGPGNRVLTRFELRNLGLWSISVPEGQPENVSRITAKIYCEEVRLLSTV